MDEEFDSRAPSGGMEQISVRISDAVRLTGLSRTRIYQMISCGDLEVAKVGRSTVVIASSLRDIITSRRIPRALHDADDC
ncbi:helix-turn-helix domain-containing protein [Novosphingobium lindaniclasticum]